MPASLAIDHATRGELGFFLAFVHVAFVLVHPNSNLGTVLRRVADRTTAGKALVTGAGNQRICPPPPIVTFRRIGMCHHNKSFSM
jgi:hypothetical protein